ncbi:Response regulator containing a CheY-like receiver domain and an HTH DNA-binding domain [Streptomyces sp. AmelKG-E11A]|nr:Response regulator containing a CheY-like receiver domain and an HTH DNA-binding domain [Streptomyces sp. AmelKG-E11A]
MPGQDGIEATRQIVATGDRTRVLILTTFDLDEYAYAGLRAGASGFLKEKAGNAKKAVVFKRNKALLKTTAFI